ITAIGQVPAGAALRRSGARVGDALYVSGTIGDAGLGLRLLSGQAADLPAAAAAAVIDRFHLPRPRLALGQALRGVATACLDVSDGLVQDLGHLCAASGVGARLIVDDLPLSAGGRAAVARGLASGGDDYELVFTAPAAAATAVAAAARSAGTPVTRVGAITSGGAVEVVDAAGAAVALARAGYRHA
ncbi:MAG: thiamine-phosphate kinase, partial [Thalassobaculaceae bacterium]